MFDGHHFVKIDDDWVFDLTDFKGYKVYKHEGTLEYELAYTISNTNNIFIHNTFIDTPLHVLRRTQKIINNNTGWGSNGKY